MHRGSDCVAPNRCSGQLNYLELAVVAYGNRVQSVAARRAAAIARRTWRGQRACRPGDGAGGAAARGRGHWDRSDRHRGSRGWNRAEARWNGGRRPDPVGNVERVRTLMVSGGSEQVEMHASQAALDALRRALLAESRESGPLGPTDAPLCRPRSRRVSVRAASGALRRRAGGRARAGGCRRRTFRRYAPRICT